MSDRGLPEPSDFNRHEVIPASVAAARDAVSAPQVGLVVTTLDDVIDSSDGVLSLREAVTEANAMAGQDTITFAANIRGGTIMLAADLPTIVDDLVIDGDPADGGPGGITILGAGGKVFTPPLSVRGAGVQLEDLSLLNQVDDDGAQGIQAIDSHLGLERIDLRVHGIPSALAIGSSGGTLDISDSLILAGAESGDALLFDGTDVIIRGSRLYSGGDYGSGVSGSGTFRMADSLASLGPSSTGKAFDVSGTVVIESSTFAGNSGGDPGGVLYPSANAITLGGDVTIVNSTFANTGIAYQGRPLQLAGLYFEPGSNVSFVNSTLTGTGYGELADFEPALGMRVGQGAIVRIANSIIDDSIDGTIVSNGANTFRDTVVGGAIAGDQLGVSADEVFALTEAMRDGSRVVLRGVLADNGGPTETVALLGDPANPALDRADPAAAPATDQRGLFRDATPDIGAFELGGSSEPPATPLPALGEKEPLADAEILGAPRAFLTLGAAGDAEIGFVDEIAAFQSSLGVYLIGPDGEIGEAGWAFERIEHSQPSDLASKLARPGGGPVSPGDSVLLSNLFDPADLGPGVELGLFLVADGAARNPFIVFDGGTLEFRTGDSRARVTDTTPQLFHIAENGVERLVLGDIMHTVDAGSPNPLSNTLNQGGTGQVTSGLLDGRFTVAFEDKPLAGSDRDFNDAVFAIDLLDGGPDLVAGAPANAADAVSAVASLETLVFAGETAV